MPLIDDQGRVFGRVNLIDAAVGVMLIALVPVAYSAYLLFKTPAPSIESIDPQTVPLAPEMRVKLRGGGLRPLLRAHIGETMARAYLYENDQSVDVLFSGVPAGTHDLVLFDGVQEVARVANGIRVVAPPRLVSSRVLVGGVFVGLDPDRARSLTAGQRAPESGDAEMEVLEVGTVRPDFRFLTAGEANVVLPLDTLVQVPALVRLRCAVVDNSCVGPDGAVESRKTMTLPHPGGPVSFIVDYMLPDETARPAEITVRFVLLGDGNEVVRAGTRDTTIASVGPAASIVSVGPVQIQSGEAGRLVLEGSGMTTERRVPDRFAVFNAVVKLDLHGSPYGWRYRAQAIRVGGPFTFNGPGYQIAGSIVAVRVLDGPSSPR
jgi:hypothetical protein